MVTVARRGQENRSVKVTGIFREAKTAQIKSAVEFGVIKLTKKKNRENHLPLFQLKDSKSDKTSGLQFVSEGIFLDDLCINQEFVFSSVQKEMLGYEYDDSARSQWICNFSKTLQWLCRWRK